MTYRRKLRHLQGGRTANLCTWNVSLTPTPPRDDSGLVSQLWDRHLPDWRTRLSKTEPRDPELDAEMVAHLNKLSSATQLSADQADFDPTEADFVQIQRRITKRKGSWWQVPKDLKD